MSSPTKMNRAHVAEVRVFACTQCASVVLSCIASVCEVCGSLDVGVCVHQTWTRPRRLLTSRVAGCPRAADWQSVVFEDSVGGASSRARPRRPQEGGAGSECRHAPLVETFCCHRCVTTGVGVVAARSPQTIAFAKATTARQLVSHLKNLTTLTYAGAEVDPVHVGNIASVHKVHLPDEWDGVVQLQYQTFLEAQRRMEHAKSRALRKRAMLPSPDYEDDDGGDGSADSDDDDDDFGALEEAVTRPTSGAPAAASASASASASARAIVGRAGAGSGAAAQAASRAGEPADGAAETTPRASAAPAPEDEEAATAMLSTARTAVSM